MLIIAMITRLVSLHERGISIDISMGFILIVISYTLLNKLKLKHLQITLALLVISIVIVIANDRNNRDSYITLALTSLLPYKHLIQAVFIVTKLSYYT